MLPKEHRYQSRKEISFVLKNCQRQYGQSLTLLVCVNPVRINLPWRLTVIAGKKSTSKLATRRNLVKRQLKSIFYLACKNLQLNGLDFIIIARKAELTAQDLDRIKIDIGKFIQPFGK